MAGAVSHKLKNAFEGALAGGGDPATSPLYVFGPFLRMIVVAGVAQVTFGASVWMVVMTIAVVSTMYRLVMRWVTDGSGGSGLSEEEFGSWAVKVNAAITFVEYTLTFLVSMAAMVTFIADRLPLLNEAVFGIQYRTIVAIVLSILTGWLVNRGPKMAARAFGPATGGVLLLLWVMIFATLFKYGFHLPDFNLDAFKAGNFHYTIRGYASILAVMTGIEVFANLVAAYDGKPAQKSRKAFNSLLMIMGTTAATMLIVGPVIMKLSDPTNEHVSVFTQTMDALLPEPLPYVGTLVGIAVLMSASAASAQGLQNLFLGLKERHYIPPLLGKRNHFDVADKPVWLEVFLVSFCFLFFGTNEETYLAIYAAGVFILLSMTGWAVTKRLIRQLKESFSIKQVFVIIGTIIAAILTTGATFIIFTERFFEGAWTYFLFIPVLYAIFSYFRKRLGEPTPQMEYLGQFDAAQLAGFGFGQAPGGGVTRIEEVFVPEEVVWEPEPIELSQWREQQVIINHVVVLLDGSTYADQAIPTTIAVCKNLNAKVTLLSAVNDTAQAPQPHAKTAANGGIVNHLQRQVDKMRAEGIDADFFVRLGSPAEVTRKVVAEKGTDLVILTTRGGSGEKHWGSGGLSAKLVERLNIPVLLVQTGEEGEVLPVPTLDNIMVALDGSIFSERTLPYARAFAKAFNSELLLLSVPAIPESEHYRSAGEVLESIRDKAVQKMTKFGNAVARSLREEGLKVESIVTGSEPMRTIVEVGDQEETDLIMLTSHGRGGLDLFLMGSVAQHVVEVSELPVFIVPIHDRE
ncbi:MAG: universal stress protein [Anaerolineaceae bacterium]|nr:universal stress protein [Anaerolineaceae bacterium]